MGSVRRRDTVAATLVLGLLASGCSVPEEPPPALRAGYDSLDGSLRVWPARGHFAADPQVTDAVTDAVARWRSPADDRVHLPSSGILWSGEVDGAALALVAADVPGDKGSWLLQLTGEGTRYRVTHASEYTDPGYLVYSDVLPVRLPAGRRYLTSARVQRLLGPDDRPVAVTDGLSDPVQVPPCAAAPVTARLIATESLPGGKDADRLIDLGTGIGDPRYPLVRDDASTATSALDGLDTCQLGGEAGPFGSEPRIVRGQEHPASVPQSWPVERISSRSLGQISLPGVGDGRVEQLMWRTTAGTMTAVVLRPRQGSPIASSADRDELLRVHLLPVGGRMLVALVWRAGSNTALSLPAGMTRLVDQPGLVVVENPATSESIRLITADETVQRSIGGA